MTAIELQTMRKIRPDDLALIAGKKRQSPRTGFVHLFHGSESGSDTIPIYENGCFALALLAQKKAETVLEARQLILRLLAFQTEEGNFPIYLHDFPRCYDPHLGLKMAAVWLRALQEFGAVLGAECKEKLEQSLRIIFEWTETRHKERPWTPLWWFRYRVCRAVFEQRAVEAIAFNTDKFSAADWWEYWVTWQWISTPTCDLYHQGLSMAMGSFPSSQDRFEPIPELIDWICADHFTERLLLDRPAQIQLSVLKGVQTVPFSGKIPGSICEFGSSHALIAARDPQSAVPIRLYWKEESLRSACLEVNGCSTEIKLENGRLFAKIDLPQGMVLQRDDVFEVSLFVDAAPGVDLRIAGEKGTAFSLRDRLSFQTASLRADVSFELLEGEGDFYGHILRANRSSQKAASGALQYEAFDWKIALRTLRRSDRCTLGMHLTLDLKIAGTKEEF